MTDEPYRSGIQGEPYRYAGTPGGVEHGTGVEGGGGGGTPSISTPSPDASVEQSSVGKFSTYQRNILDRLVELTRDQNPDWDYVYADSETAMPDGYAMDTIEEIAGGGAPPPPVAHNLLSATHTDTLAVAVAQGDLITGQGVFPLTAWTSLPAGIPGDVLTMGVTDPAWVAPGGGGDDILVNAVACTDGNFNNLLPAAPANSLNVLWQRAAAAPDNISAYFGYGAGLGVAGGVLVCTITQYTDELAQDAIGGGVVATATITPTYNDVANQFTWDVNNDSITFAKMQNIATDSLIGRDTALAGDPENITLGAGLAMSGAGALVCSITQYTDELAQDAVGGAFVATATITPTYNDVANQMTWDVNNDSITYAKIQNVSASPRLLGRSSIGAGDTEELTVGTGLSLVGGNLTCTIVDTDKVMMYGQVLASGTGTDQYMFNGSVQYGALSGNMMMRAGSITGISAVGAITDGIGLGPMQIQVFKNGILMSSGPLNCLVTINKADPHQYTTFASGVFTFVAGDILQFYLDIQTASARVADLMAVCELTLV